MLLIYHTNTALQNCAICYILLACIVSQPSTGRAPQHWTRERLDTLRQHRSGRSASRRSGDRRRETRRQHQRQIRPEIKPRSGTPEEPEPARQRRRRQDRQQTPSPTRAAEIEPEPESQKRGTVDHGRRRTETERRRAEKRGNEEKTTVKRRFSPRLTERQQINRQSQPRTGRHGQPQKRRLFRFCFCGVCGINGDQRQFLPYGRRGRFIFSRPHQRQKFGFVPSSPRLYLFHQAIISQTHRSSTIYFLTNINILCYSLLFGRMP